MGDREMTITETGEVLRNVITTFSDRRYRLVTHQRELKVGDHVAFPRIHVAALVPYFHHGIVIQLGSVFQQDPNDNQEDDDSVMKTIELAVPELGEEGYDDRCYCCCPVPRIMRKKYKTIPQLYVVDYERKDVLPPEQVVERAERALGEEGYNLFHNNCEHFAASCKIGKHLSQQVVKNNERIGQYGVRVSGAVLALVAAVLLIKAEVVAVGVAAAVAGCSVFLSEAVIFLWIWILARKRYRCAHDIQDALGKSLAQGLSLVLTVFFGVLGGGIVGSWKGAIIGGVVGFVVGCIIGWGAGEMGVAIRDTMESRKFRKNTRRHVNDANGNVQEAELLAQGSHSDA